MPLLVFMNGHRMTPSSSIRSSANTAGRELEYKVKLPSLVKELSCSYSSRLCDVFIVQAGRTGERIITNMVVKVSTQPTLLFYS